MKVRELILELQKLPDQDAEVVDRNNDPLYSVHQDYGYYNGRYSQLKIDESQKPYYHIVGMTTGKGGGMKAVFNFYSYQDVLDNDRDASVTYEDGKIPCYVTEYRSELDKMHWRLLTEPLHPGLSNCQNRVLIQYDCEEDYLVFKNKIEGTIKKWRKVDRRCYDIWYPEFCAFRYYDLTNEQIELLRIASKSLNVEPYRFIVSHAEVK